MCAHVIKKHLYAGQILTAHTTAEWPRFLSHGHSIQPLAVYLLYHPVTSWGLMLLLPRLMIQILSVKYIDVFQASPCIRWENMKGYADVLFHYPEHMLLNSTSGHTHFCKQERHTVYKLSTYE